MKSNIDAPGLALSAAAAATAAQTVAAVEKPGVVVVATDKPKLEKRWNTHHLGWRLGTDLISAASAGVMVAPIITMIDRSIMENASGRNTVSQSLRNSLKHFLLRPANLFIRTARRLEDEEQY